MAKQFTFLQVTFFTWLRKLLHLWIRSKVIPADALNELGIDADKPVCFVLKTKSLFDRLVFNDQFLRLNFHEKIKKYAGFFYLTGKGEIPIPLKVMIEKKSAGNEEEIQLVPVSVFWGREAGSEEKSFFKLFFSDDDNAGFIRKFFIMIVNGRNVYLQFSKPLSFKDQFTPGHSLEQIERKIVRILRVHFTNLRRKVLGPNIVSRKRVAEVLLRNKSMIDAIEEDARKKGQSTTVAKMRARKYIFEIAAEVVPKIISASEMILTKLWNKIYEGVEIYHSERVRSIPSHHQIVYVPCHRSHMDYLLVGYALYHVGVATPYVAAGINLNFWPVGLWLRRIGAFYIRRTFNNNRLYTTSFQEYIHFLVGRGFPIKFFIEGQRSRVGKIMPPKTGMLAMIVHSFLRLKDKPVTIVPVYIGYDKVPEVRTYVKELSGEKKKPESIRQLFNARKILRSKHGKAYVTFAPPISLSEFMSEKQPDWSLETQKYDTKPQWMSTAVNKLSYEILSRINSCAILTPVALVSVIMLATRQKAMAENELRQHIKVFIDLIQSSSFFKNVKIPHTDPQDVIDYAEKYSGMQRLSYPDGDILFLVEPSASYVIYYRNNIVHLFVMASLVACFFHNHDSISEKKLVLYCEQIYPILKREFYLQWTIAEFSALTKETLNHFVDQKLLVRDSTSSSLCRPGVDDSSFAHLRILGWIIAPTVERFAITVALLKSENAPIDLVALEKKAASMFKRLSLLSGISHQDFATPNVFRYIVDYLKTIQAVTTTLDDDHVLITEKFDFVFEVVSHLLSVDMRHSLERLSKSEKDIVNLEN